LELHRKYHDEETGALSGRCGPGPRGHAGRGVLAAGTKRR